MEICHIRRIQEVLNVTLRFAVLTQLQSMQFPVMMIVNNIFAH